MKIGTSELKIKPATKYFDGGYVSFWTVERNLHYVIYHVTKTIHASINSGVVKDLEHLNNLLAIKNINEAVNQ